jgi:hypothetical protein
VDGGDVGRGLALAARLLQTSALLLGVAVLAGMHRPATRERETGEEEWATSRTRRERPGGGGRTPHYVAKMMNSHSCNIHMVGYTVVLNLI